MMMSLMVNWLVLSLLVFAGVLAKEANTPYLSADL